MSVARKTEWIRPYIAARLLKVARNTVMYRAGQGRYGTKLDENTGMTLISRRDVERDVKAQQAA